MNTEIERKFLLNGSFKEHAVKQVRITQGYLSSVPERTVRIRIQEDKSYITIKGSGNLNGTSRLEWEKEIALEDAEELLKICEPGIIDKVRYIIPVDGHIFEVDEFHGDNEGLVIAEIELGDEDEAFEKPAWLGAEVTGDPKYYNAMLTRHPYKKWDNK